MDGLGFEERGKAGVRLSRRRAAKMRTDRAGPNRLNINDGVISRRPAGGSARLAKAASLARATHYPLRAFWTSCRLR